jgi:GH25 family lysozyme M1 (1,4-beta-N-acetylmuramidase)
VDLFVDLSNNNASPDFARLKAAGVRAAILKATEGLTFTDPDFQGWARSAHAAGLDVGSYHFAHPGEDPVAQARHYLSVIEPAGTYLTLRPVLDLEQGTPEPAFFDWTVAFNHRVKLGTNRFPIFYSYTSYITGMRCPRPLGSGLWLAAYGPNDGTDHGSVAPAPWRKWIAHQFTSAAHVPGVGGDVDLSHTPGLGLLRA